MANISFAPLRQGLDREVSSTFSAHRVQPLVNDRFNKVRMRAPRRYRSGGQRLSVQWIMHGALSIFLTQVEL